MFEAFGRRMGAFVWKHRFFDDGHKGVEIRFRATEEGQRLANAFRASFKAAGVENVFSVEGSNRSDGSSYESRISVSAQRLTIDDCEKIKANLAVALGESFSKADMRGHWVSGCGKGVSLNYFMDASCSPN